MRILVFLLFALAIIPTAQAYALSSEAEEFIRLLEKSAGVRCELAKLKLKLRRAEKQSDRPKVSAIINQMKTLTGSFDKDAHRMMQLLPGLTKSGDFPEIVKKQKSMDKSCK